MAVVVPTPEENLAAAKQKYKDDVQTLGQLVKEHIVGGYQGPMSFVNFLRDQTKEVLEDVKVVQACLAAVNINQSGGWLQ